jgi:hypothetical protein
MYNIKSYNITSYGDTRGIRTLTHDSLAVDNISRKVTHTGKPSVPAKPKR